MFTTKDTKDTKSESAESFMTRRPRLTQAQVRECLMRFIDGTCGPYDWDDFCSVSIGDAHLDEIRERCTYLDSEFPPKEPGHFCNEEGVNVIREFIKQLS